jgi:hypothetical protein
MSKKKNTFNSGSNLGLFSGSGSPGGHKKNSSSGDKYTDRNPHANIGWLFAIDYYKNIDKIKKETEKKNRPGTMKRKTNGLPGKNFQAIMISTQF